MKSDFSGYATKSDVMCSDGRVILAHAFKSNDGQKVPLVWQHGHGSTSNILGHALLEDRADGVYAYGFFNNSDAGKEAREFVEHGDINSLSIFADQLVQRGERVVQGQIREVSLVLAGANSEAVIDNVSLSHGYMIDSDDTAAVISSGLHLDATPSTPDESLKHSSEEGDDVSAKKVNEEEPESKKERSPQEVYDSMDDDQKKLLEVVVAEAAKANADKDDKDDEDDDDKDDSKDDAKDDSSEPIQHSAINNQENNSMSRNVFDQGNNSAEVKGATLTHSQLNTILEDAKNKFAGSTKQSFLAHAAEYGIENIDFLFPEAKNLDTSPQFLKRQTEWVSDVLTSVHRSPMARIKSVVADITAEEARAKGYVTGTLKKDEIISLLKRTTGPTTIYKKQKLDRDDVIDITELDVIVWIKAEMRLMINEEIARAILLGDGRSTGDADKIKDPSGNEGNGIRSIAHDSSFYTHRVTIASNSSTADILEALTRARTHYRGSGAPVFYTTDSFISDALLLEDKIGRRIYNGLSDIAAAIRVSRIVAVEAMEAYPTILGIVVNLSDYTVGTNKGGELNFFDDFDIDWNQLKYLIETRLSGALTKPKSALVIKRNVGTAANPVSPSFNGETNTITIPSTTGIDYTIDGDIVTGNVVIEFDTEVDAVAKANFYIPSNTVTSWTFVHTSTD